MKKISSLLIYSGVLVTVLAAIALLVIYYPIIKLELEYRVEGPGVSTNGKVEKPLVPIDTEFGIVIPKIRANAKIIPNVDPYDSRVYQWALTKGVAQAMGTGFPGQGKNIFLFSHSSVNFYEAARYNSIFYLLDKLEKNDEIDIYYKNKKFVYKVTDKKTVPSKDVSYLESQTANREQLTLMTCWPPGTTWRRLLIIGNLVSNI